MNVCVYVLYVCIYECRYVGDTVCTDTGTHICLYNCAKLNGNPILNRAYNAILCVFQLQQTVQMAKYV